MRPTVSDWRYLLLSAALGGLLAVVAVVVGVWLVLR